MKNLIALEPKKFPAYIEAIESVGGKVTALDAEVRAMVWTDYADVAGLEKTLDQNPQLEWVQLPFAGVDAFASVLKRPITFTSAKGSYAEPVAEHALALALALGRIIPERVRAKSWGRKFADSLFDEDVLIIGGGGIAVELVHMLAPFRSKISVIRKRPDEGFLDGVEVLGFESFLSELPKAKFVFLACALTAETRFLFGREAFAQMRNDAYLVNVARGEVIDQEALFEALTDSEIAGAGIDVTYPEPLPDSSPLWALENLIITPHTADTPAMVIRMFSERLHVNVAAWLAGNSLTGTVDPDLGY